VSAPVFLAERGAADPLTRFAPGDTYVLDGAEGRHAGVVQRRRAGERVDVVDGEGTRLRTVVVSADRDILELRVEVVEVEPAPAVRLVLVQALAKGDRDELAIEAATEVGVDAVLPWQAERSVVVWRGERAARSRARWLATVRAAAKQSRRARVPEIRQDVTTAALADVVRATVAAGGQVAVLHEDATEPLGALALPAPAAGDVVPEVLVVVGPEGGISDAELERLTEAGGRPVRLGPHVLRTSTAGPVALTLLCERLGRWA
jgi:16S rRNA (uracil1498-N3)-methyltransferase